MPGLGEEEWVLGLRRTRIFVRVGAYRVSIPINGFEDQHPWTLSRSAYPLGFAAGGNYTKTTK